MVVPIELSASDRNTAVRETVNGILPFPLIKPLREGLAGGRAMDKNELSTRELDMDVTKRAFEIALNTTLRSSDPSLLFRRRFNQQIRTILGKPIQDVELRREVDLQDTLDKVKIFLATVAILSVKLRAKLITSQQTSSFGIAKLEKNDVVISLTTLLDPSKINLGHLYKGFKVKNVVPETNTIVTEGWEVFTPEKEEKFLFVRDARAIWESADHALTRGDCLLALTGRLKALHENLLGI